MSCFWKCVKVEPTDENNEWATKEPIVDLIELIEQLAWKEVRKDPPQLSVSERCCGLQKVCRLDVDRTFITVLYPNRLELHPKPMDEERGETEDGDSLSDGPSDTVGKGQALQRQTVLFESRFRNDTSVNQTYSFKTERQTKSTVEMTLQRGFTLGQSLEIDVKIPTGVKGCKVSGKLGGQMQWSFTRGKVSRQEEQVTWSVDNHVIVCGNTKGTAKLEVEENRWNADFSVECLIRPRPINDEDVDDADSDSDDAGPTAVRFPVFVRRRTTGQLIKVQFIPRQAIIASRPEHFREYEKDKSTIRCTLKGGCHSVCAVNQRVWLDDKVIARPEKPTTIRQDSVIIESK